MLSQFTVPFQNNILTSCHRTLSLLITANPILDHQQILTGIGHVSVRNPLDNATFFMTGSKPPALARSPDDLFKFNVEDASPANDLSINQPKLSERFIHQAIYKRFPDQNSVVHSHARSVVSYGISGAPFRPTYHTAGFIGEHQKHSYIMHVCRLTIRAGEEAPVFDIADYYLPNDTQNMLVNSLYLGDALARTFLTSAHNTSVTDITEPDHTLVLQRGHGFTVLAANLPQAVYRAVYTAWNAEVDISALTIHQALGARGEIEHLTPRQATDCLTFDDAGYSREWPVWAAQVDANPLYRNDLGYAEVPKP